jgi:hypothetical protein
MNRTVDPIAHEFAVLLASKQKSGKLSEAEIKRFFGNYLIAIRTLDALDKNVDFCSDSARHLDEESE